MIPDVVWVSNERLSVLLNEAEHLTGAPELIVEVLSPDAENERRDREVKLKLYALQGVQEYWIADRRLQQVQVCRRQAAILKLVATLLVGVLSYCFSARAIVLFPLTPEKYYLKL